jgi:hypothetical protein
MAARVTNDAGEEDDHERDERAGEHAGGQKLEFTARAEQEGGVGEAARAEHEALDVAARGEREDADGLKKSQGDAGADEAGNEDGGRAGEKDVGQRRGDDEEYECGDECGEINP